MLDLTPGPLTIHRDDALLALRCIYEYNNFLSVVELMHDGEYDGVLKPHDLWVPGMRGTSEITKALGTIRGVYETFEADLGEHQTLKLITAAERAAMPKEGKIFIGHKDADTKTWGKGALG